MKKGYSTMKKLLVFLFFIILSFMFLNASVVNADANIVDSKFYTNVKEVAANQKFNVIFNVNPSKEIEKGINAYKAQLIYDKDVFENIKEEDFSTLNGWEMLEYNENTGEFVLISKSGIKKSQDIFDLDLTVKSSVNNIVDDLESKIILKNIAVSEGIEDINIKEATVLVNISSNQNSFNDTTNNVAKPVNSTSSSNNSSDITEKDENDSKIEVDTSKDNSNKKDDFDDNNDNNNDDDEKKSGGFKHYISIILIILAVICFILLFLILIFKLSDDDDNNNNSKINKELSKKYNRIKTLLLIIGVCILSISIIYPVEAAYYDYKNKGDVNGDGEIDYDDVRLMEYHLINEKSINDEYLYNADISGDTHITITDLSLLIQKVEDKLIYNAEINNISASNYINKGEDYTIYLDANINYGAYIEKVKVNGSYYDADLINDNKYSITFKVDNSAGVKNYKFEELLLNNGKIIDVDFESKVTVLKSVPEFNNYSVEYDNKNSEANIIFNIYDVDNALGKSFVELYDSNNKLVEKYNIKSGNNSLKASLEDNTKYIIKFNINYNTVSLGNDETEGKLEFSKELQLNLDYGFELKNVKVSESSYNKNEKINITFESFNKTKYKPSTVVVNNKEYSVDNTNGKYSIKVAGFNKGGANTLSIDSIILENGKKFDVDERITVYVNKDIPTIKNLRLIEDSSIDGVVTGFSVVDNDDALSNVSIRLLDENDNVLEEIKLTNEEIKDKFGVSKKFKREFVSKYKIKVIGDYSLTGSDNDLKSDVVLAEKEINAITVVELVNVISDKKYYDKNESIVLTYTFKTNKKDDITKVTINDKDYDVINNGGKYVVTLSGYDNYGVKRIMTTKVTYNDNESISINSGLDIEVLKDVPTIKIDEIDEDIDNSSLTISFDVLDKDDSISSSILEIVNSSDEVIDSFNIKKGTNTFEINVEESKKYIARFAIKYNLSSDNNNNDKLVLGNILLERELQLNINYDFAIDSFKIYDMNGNETATFNKNEDIKLVFNSTNATIHKIKRVIINGKEYAAQRENDSYSIIISGFDKYGNNDINVEKVVLENNKTFDINKKFDVKINKEIPKIYDFNLSENNKNDTVDVEFSLIDINNSLSKVIVMAYDSKNNIIKEITLSAGEIEKAGRITKSFDATYTSKYKVCIIGTYSLTDSSSDEKKDVVLAEKEIVATPKAEITSVSSDKKYYEKNSNVSLTYNIMTNKEIDIIKITIGGKDYDTLKNSDGSYNVIYTLDSVSGIKTLEATNIIFSDDSNIEVKNTLNVEVLKDIPKLVGYKETDDIDNSQVIVEFTIEDSDYSLVSGNAILTNKNDKSKDIKSIKVGKNRIVFDVKELVSYTFDVSITYDRDSNEDSTNRVSDKVIYTNEIAGIYEYNLKVSNVKVKNSDNESKYFNKNEKIFVEFESSNDSSFEPSKVVINGKTYSVNKSGKVYIAELFDLNEAGIQDLNIEKIILSNNKELDVKNQSSTIEILKDKPSIENIKIIEEINEPSMTVSFDVVNSDKAIIDGKIIVVDSNNTIVKESIIKNGTNTVKAVVEDGKKYIAKFEVNYNLSANKNNNDKEVLGSISIEKELQLNIDYKFAINDFKAYSNNSESTVFKKNEDIKLVFSSTNATTHNITKIIVNGILYDVLKEKDSYSVILNGFTKYGNNTINIEKVVLDNNKEFNVNKSLNIIVKKAEPEIYDLDITENIDNNTVDVEFSLIDVENSLNEVIVRLTDGDNKVIEDIKLTTEEIEKSGKINKSFNRVFTSNYKVSIIGTYSLTDNNNDVVKDKILSEKSIVASARAEITGSKSNKTYYEKSEEVVLTYNIKTNRSEDITNITINSKNYDISKNSDGSYSVIYKLDNMYGIKELKATKITFSDNSNVVVKDTLNVEVLKDKPKVNDYNIINDVSNSSIIVGFTIIDNDDSFVSGDIVLTNKIDGSKEIKNIKLGKNNIIFEVKELDSYKLEIITIYDRDSSNDNGTSSDTFSRDIKPEFDYELIFGNVISINGDVETEYFNKGMPVTIEFDSTNITSFTPMKVVIDGNEYEVTKSGDSYKVVVDGSDIIGVKTLTIEKLILSNLKEIEITKNNTVEIEILKDKPSLNNYKVIEDINNSSLNISFDFNDKDSSLVNGEVKIVDVDNNDILTYEISNGSNIIEIPVIDGKKYNALFNINYNLSSKENNNDKDVIGVISRKEQLQLNIDYKFVVSDFVTYSNNSESTLFDKDEDIKLMFSSTNATNHTISKVVIDGEEYSPSYENDKYSVFLPNIDKAGFNTITIDKIILDNGKYFDIDKKVEVYVRKSIPAINNLKLSENKDYSIKSSFKLIDSDNSLIKLIIRLSDSNNNLIKDIELSADEIKNAGNISKIFDDTYKSSYNVSIIGSYSLSNDSNDTFTDVVLEKTSLSATPRAEIIDSRIDGDKLYYEKGEDVTLIYNIRTNSDSDITKVTINNKNYDALKNSDGSYNVIYTVGNSYGVKSLDISKVTYKDNKNASVNDILSIDVLKDAPVVTEFKQTEDVGANKVTIEFTIEDSDNSFESGEAFLTNKTNNSRIEKKVSVNHNIFEFEIDSNNSYSFSIYLTYDRDSNALTSGDNRHENVVAKEVGLVLNTDYDFALSNLKTYINKVESRDFSKNQQIQLGFNSNNSHNVELASVKVNGNVYSDIEKVNGRYYVLVDGFNVYGSKDLVIEEATLINGKYFEIADNNSISVNILKDQPVVVDVDTAENVNDSKLAVNFNLKDDDKAINKLDIILYDENNNEISRNSLSKDEIKSGWSSRELKTALSEKYKVVIDAIYNIGKDDVHKVLYEQDVTAEVVFNIKNITLTKEYYYKDESIILEYEFETNQKADVSKIYTSNIEHNAVKLSDNEYQIRLDRFTDAGVYDITTTKVILSNNMEFAVSEISRFEIIKDIPEIVNKDINEDQVNSTITYAFDVLDVDKAVKDGKITVIDSNNKTIGEFVLEKGHNEVSFDAIDGMKYKINTEINYNVFSNKEMIKTLTLEDEVQLNMDYKFTFSNLKTYSSDVETTDFYKYDLIRVGFDSTNATKFEISSVKINDKTYTVSNEDNHYYVTVDPYDKFGNYNIVVEEVTLSNNHKITLTKNNSVSIRILSKKPSITNFSYTENASSNRLDVGFRLTDDDDTLSLLDIVLLGDNDKEISRNRLTGDELNVSEVSRTLTTSKSNKYKVRIIGTYETINDSVTEVLLEEEIDAQLVVSIKNINPNKKYYSKDEVIYLNYEVETNSSENVSMITVNGTDYEATRLYNISDSSNLNNSNSDYDLYQIKLDGISKAGVVNFKTTNVIFDNDTEYELEDSVKVEILKDAPYVSFDNNVEDIQNSKIIHSFNIVDDDNSFISGKAIVTKNSDGSTREFTVKKGFNELEIPVEYGKEYTASLYVTYDLDTNELTTTDNLYPDEKISEHGLVLRASYQLVISNLKTYNEIEESSYFSSGENINVEFDCTNITSFKPVSAVVNGKTYDVFETNGKYRVSMDGFTKKGVQDIKIEKIILDNTHEEVITNNNSIKVEVLKTKATVSGYSFDEDDSGDVTVKFKVTDSDNTITNNTGKVYIFEDGIIAKEQSLVIGNNTIKFTSKSNKKYTIKIVADYDLDTNKLGSGFNEYKSVTLYENEISLGSRAFEVKDITKSTVYVQKDTGVEEVSTLNVSDLSNLSKYVVKVETRNMPTFYTTINNYRIENNRLKLSLDYDNVVQYDGNVKQNKLEIDYGSVKDGVVEYITFESIIERMKENPSGTFELTQDYDLSGLSVTSTALVPGVFTGTLNGNGHTLSNLNNASIFESFRGTVENLNIKGFTFIGSSNCISAFTQQSYKATFRNMTFDNITLSGQHSVGVVAGLDGVIDGKKATNSNSVFENISVTNANAAGTGVYISTFVGRSFGGRFSNIYVQGSINTSSTENGGVVGSLEERGIIENVITNVSISKPNNTYTGKAAKDSNGGVVGQLYTNASVRNSIAFGNMVGYIDGDNGANEDGDDVEDSELLPYKFTGATEATIITYFTNCYEVDEEIGFSRVSENTQGKLDSVSRKNLNRQFYLDLGLNESIWDLAGVSENTLPKLKISETDNSDDDEDVSSGSLYIPGYGRIRKSSSYDKNKDTLYHNIYKLMPYYDSKYLIEDGIKISSDNILYSKAIKHVLPFSDGKLLSYLSLDNYNSITSIKVVFDDNSIKTYNVTFKNLSGNISIYDIEGLDLEYAYDNYVINTNSEVVNMIIDYIKNVDYATVLDPLTAAADSRLYKDHFNGVIKANAERIALQLLQNDDNNVLTLNNSVLNNKIKQDLINNGRLNRLLYSYNYYDRWYQFEIGGARVIDILLFQNEMFKDNIRFNSLVNEVFGGSIATNTTANFFAANLSKYTGSSTLQNFLNGLITNLGEYEDVDDWFTEYFSTIGIVKELPVKNRPDIIYRAWQLLNKKSNYVLPYLTLPKNSGYIISGGIFLQMGAQVTYSINPDTVQGQKDVNSKLTELAGKIETFVNTLAGTFNTNKWNSINIYMYDSRKYVSGYGYLIPGVPNTAYAKYSVAGSGTSQPYFKNFNEAVNVWGKRITSAGYADGANVFFDESNAADFKTWTHELGHDIDDKVMLSGSAIRGTSEDYTDGNVTQHQAWGTEGAYYFNLAFSYGKESLATFNLTPSRIDTREKLENYFHGQQQTLDYLDYVEAKAFLLLTPEEQAKIAYRISHSGTTTKWNVMTAEEIEAMNLKTVEDLWDNQIILRPDGESGIGEVKGNVNTPMSQATQKYGFEKIWVRRWYIQHVDTGRSNAWAFKKNMFEMLGSFGYNGYKIYGSKLSKNDLDAIQKITGDPEMTWKKYQMNKYADLESKWNNANVDSDYLMEKYKEALELDAKNTGRNVTNATNIRKVYYYYLKGLTNDFVNEPIDMNPEITHIKTAEELVTKISAKPYGNYVLDNDLDFTGYTGKVNVTFMGKLDGNGHTIIGNTNAIFQKIRYGYVKNLNFRGTRIPRNVTNIGILANNIQFSVIEDIDVVDVVINSSGRNTIGLIGGSISTVSYKNCNVEQLVVNIASAEDFAKINEDAGGLYNIVNDIDFTGYSASGSVISSAFTGKIEGNGYTISNLNNAALFKQFNGTVENLNIRDFSNVATGDNVAAFAINTNTATIKNMKFENITVRGANRVAVVSGFDDSNSTFENISVTNANVTGTGVYVSTFVGRKYSGAIRNVYVQGSLTINSTENGGLVGALQKNGSIVENVITDVTINKTHNTYPTASLSEVNGSMIGNIYDNAIVRNSIAFGNMTGYTSAGVELKPYKFTGASEAQVIARLTNCYEVDEEIGSSRVNENTVGKLDSISRAKLNKQFYLDLGFDESIWDLNNLTSKGYPTLKK